ncbi:ArsR family transcriptional regulator, partial [Nostoc linckia z16]
GLVLSEKEGRNIKYTIDPNAVNGYIHFLTSLK